MMLHDRSVPLEKVAADRIALRLLQYTPEVAFAGEASLLLDVTASLRAFGGRLALCRRVRASVAALGFTPQIGMAPTAQGAWLLALAG
jgi:protein ImuB